MEKFCEDIGVEPENVVMLVLAWKMNARQMGFFTQQEWLRGLMDLQWVLQRDPPQYLSTSDSLTVCEALDEADWSTCSVCLRCDSISKVQSKLDYLRLLLNDQVAFKSIYRYAYDFARVNDTCPFI